MPDISMTFSKNAMLEDLSFHPSVRIGRWISARVLTFIPPDGNFELMGYRLGSSSPVLWRDSAELKSTVPIPVYIKPIITVGEVGGSFSISVSKRTISSGGAVASLEDLHITLCLGDNATGVNGSISSAGSLPEITPNKGSTSAGGPVERLPPGGIWEFDTISHTLKWRISKLTSNSPVFSGTWLYDDSKARSRPSPSLVASFTAPLSNVSGLSVANLTVEGEKYSVYKGIRSHLKGTLEVRW